MIDLFEALPSLEPLITSPDSCVDAFYRIAGAHEPAEGSLRIQSAKLWVRTVASLYHAALALPRGAGLLWADFDAVTTRPLDERFWRFVRQHDVAYAPYVDIPHIPTRVWRLHRLPEQQGGHADFLRLTNLSDPEWRASPSILSLTVGKRSRVLLEAILRHYDGSGVALARSCLCAPPPPPPNGAKAPRPPLPHLPCEEEWFAENLYFGIGYVWSLHLQWAARGAHPDLRNLSQVCNGM
jgi:hypothetical protein